MEANARFHETTRLDIRIARLDIVELYVDTAITATYALRHLQERLAAQAALQQTQLVCRRGARARRRRSPASVRRRHGAYWPRLIVTDAADDATRVAGSADGAPATALADTLHFLYVGAARPRRVGAAATPARADREAGAPADPRPHMEQGLRTDAVPADGAARLQGRGATARPGGAGGRRDDGEPAVGADARRRPHPQRERPAAAGAAHGRGPPAVVDAVPPPRAAEHRADRAGDRQPVGQGIRRGILHASGATDRRSARPARCASRGRSRRAPARRHGLRGQSGAGRRLREHGAVRAVPAFLAHPAHLGARRVRPAPCRRSPAQRRSAVRRPADHRGRDRGDGSRARPRVPELLPPGHRGRSTVRATGSPRACRAS